MHDTGFSLVLTLQVSCQVQFQFVITSLLPFFQPYIARTVSTNTSNQSSRFHMFPVLCHSVKFEMSACFNLSSPLPLSLLSLHTQIKTLFTDMGKPEPKTKQKTQQSHTQNDAYWKIPEMNECEIRWLNYGALSELGWAEKMYMLVCVCVYVCLMLLPIPINTSELFVYCSSQLIHLSLLAARFPAFAQLQLYPVQLSYALR